MKLRFVRYKTKAAAATAIEMFKNYSIGCKTLLVKYATQSNSRASTRDSRDDKIDSNLKQFNLKNSNVKKESSFYSTTNLNSFDEKSDIDSSFSSGKRSSNNQLAPKGRGQIIQAQKEKLTSK